MLKKIRNAFSAFLKAFKEDTDKKQGKLIIQKGLPPIDNRAPLVQADKEEKKEENTEEVEKISKTCSLCKHANHCVDSFDFDTVTCELHDKEVSLDHTCKDHEPKYPNLKVIMDTGTLLEYDSENAKEKKPAGFTSPLKQKGIEEIGEDKWLA